ncbi:hypothetical protein CAOG_05957 [Capsaspora owczarzaki ATCC 30864]|uniref:PH domain-containing protein n=1 Tax=Capsaspora owczarzaki (strain ATCC 30864) TaxID=595528 RepID=A0A0D2WUC7_CAPO3|nr:hypothetical protein CAOG_05957 [Capsaspora owczarzaki ATCC 30864]KJE95508.1 hypothetical protein CAOG_005957 [Capsaspora owczarzaki ATCC 30864]|eukprot:XP_004345547.1 hypothetical protein CAOG_05957 [Capsaspora owczarzaki ATCC 30864]
MTTISHPVFERAVNGKDMTAIGELFAVNADDVAQHTESILAGISAKVDSEAYGSDAGEKTCIESSVSAFMVAARNAEDLLIDNIEHFVALIEVLLKYNLESGKPHAELLKNVLYILQSQYSKAKIIQKSLATVIKVPAKGRDDGLNQTVAGMFAMTTIVGGKIFVPYVSTVINLVLTNPANQRSSFLTVLNNVYPFAREEVHPFVPKLVKIFDSGDMGSSVTALQILSAVAKKNPELLEKFIDDFVPALSSPMSGAMAIMMLVDLAVAYPDHFVKHLDDIKASVSTNQTFIYNAPKIIGAVGRSSEERARQSMETLFEWLKTSPDQNAVPLLMLEIKNVAGAFKASLTPYLDFMQEYIKSTPNESTRTVGQSILDAYHDRTLENLGNQVVATDAKIEVVVKDTQEVKAKVEEVEKRVLTLEEELKEIDLFVQDHISELKEFVAGIVKKLPIPMNFTTEDRFLKIQKVLVLHFECACKSPHCQFSKGKTFRTETKVINKWIKVAFSAIQVGKAIWDKDVGAVVEGLRSVYEIGKSQYDTSFQTFITEPFLTSSESDELINQLRDAKFFEAFEYDAQLGNWVCHPCAHPPAPVAEPAAVAVVASPVAAAPEAASSSAAEPAATPAAATPAAATPAAATPVAAPPAILEGVLHKRGGKIVRQWQARNFKLTEKTLEYRLIGKDGLRGSIELSAVTAAELVPVANIKRPHTFSLVTSLKTYHISADSDETATKWQTAIAGLINRS